MKKIVPLLLGLLLSLSVAHAAEKNVSISLESSATALTAGVPVDVDVYIENPSNYSLTSATLAIQYDTTVFDGTSISYGGSPYFDVDIYPGEEQKFRADGLIRLGRASLSDGTGKDLKKILFAKVTFTPRQTVASTEIKLAEVVDGEDAYVIKMLENGAYVEVESEAARPTLQLPALHSAATTSTTTTGSNDINAAFGIDNTASTTDTTTSIPVSTTDTTQIVTTSLNNNTATYQPDARELATFEEEYMASQGTGQVANTDTSTTQVTQSAEVQEKLKKAPATPGSGPMEVMLLCVVLSVAGAWRLRLLRQ